MAFDLAPEKFDAFKKGDLSVFTYDIYEKCSSNIIAEAFSILNIKQDAEEVAGDAFKALYDARETLTSPKHINNFLYLAVRNMSINLLKVNRRRNDLITTTDPDSLEETSDHANNTLFLDQLNSQVIVDEFHRQIRHGLENLTPQRQKVIRLHYLEGWTVDDIARHMNISTDSVYTHKRLGLKDLREKHEKEYEKIRSHLPLLVFCLLLKLFY